MGASCCGGEEKSSGDQAHQHTNCCGKSHGPRSAAPVLWFVAIAALVAVLVVSVLAIV